MSETPCPTCKGKCCRDDLGYRIEHMAAESYWHHCDDCHDGTVPTPVWTAADERAAVAAWLRTVAPNAPTRRGADELAWCAEAIERGAHRTGEGT